MGDPADDLAPGEVAIAVVDGLELAAVDRDAGSLQHPDAAAEFDEPSADPADRWPIVAAEIGDGLVIGCQPPGQPHHLDVPARLTLEPATGWVRFR